MRFSSLEFLIGEAARNIRRNGLMSVAALVTVARGNDAGRIGVVDVATGRLQEYGSGAGPRYAPGRLKQWLGQLTRNYPQAMDLFNQVRRESDCTRIDA